MIECQKNILFLDLDGVMVDFHRGLCKLYNVNYDDPEVHKLITSMHFVSGGPFGTHDQVDATIQKAGYDFWMNLEILPWADRLYETLLDSGYPVIFLTSPSDFSDAAKAKHEFVRKHWKTDKIIITREKQYCAQAGRLLVDDYGRNIVRWEGYGGTAFKWPSPWELTTCEAVDNTFLHLKEVLRVL